MIKTLLTRISILRQYNSEDKTILWEDPTNSRWDNVYGKLVKDDNAIFISDDKLLIGIISQVNIGKSILCINIQEVNCKNDQFLRLHAVYPELISRVKANFQPFIHPIELDLKKLTEDVENKNFINFYILSEEQRLNNLFQSIKENDRVVLLDSDQYFENVKLYSKQGLINFPAELDININIERFTIDEVIQINKNYKRKSVKSNNVKRIEKIKEDINTNGIFKFTSFFTYHDTLFNKLVYQKKEEKNLNINTIYLNSIESVFKVSMSGKDIDDKSFTFFNDNNLIIVHSKTKAKGVSSQSQGDTFAKQMKIGDYFYMCRGNNSLEVIGRITGDASTCEYEDFGNDGWIQRSYEIVSEAIKEDSYSDEKKWWTPNDNSTCIVIPPKEIIEANTKIFIPFFNSQFGHKNTLLSTISKTPNNMNNFPLNQILYGPPGTGKTFKLQQIINDWDLAAKTGTEKDFYSFAKNYTWWQIIALVLVDQGNSTVPDIAKHHLIIAKLGSSNVKSLNTRLWSSLQHHTVDNCIDVKLVKRMGTKVFYKEKNSAWRLDNLADFQSEFSALIEDYEEFKKSDNIEAKNYTFTTCHQSLSYEDFIEGIKPELNDSDNLDDEESKNLIYEIRKGIFYNACEKAAQKAGFINLKDCLDRTKQERKIAFDKANLEGNIHVLFLDEINRCNVSNVFGELITLIEEDKRLGGENEIADITLPYSQEEFGVPANLYIIGTMNTADRSVEALDTALRRRFCFEEMPPKYDLKELDNEIFAIKTADILQTINNRIEKLLGKDHTIGHSYFLSKNETTMVDSFYKNIIPLLQEYFFGDYRKIGLILGKGFVKLKELDTNDDVFADFDGSTDYADREVFEIVDYRTTFDYILKFNKADLVMTFEKAIKILMKQSVE